MSGKSEVYDMGSNRGIRRGRRLARREAQRAVEFLRREDGISSVEYALLLAFIGAGVMLAAGGLALAVSNGMFDASNTVESAGN